VRSASEAEQNIVNVERILHQTEVEPEAPHEILDTRPDGVWPSQVQLSFGEIFALLIKFKVVS
jgi:ATP-binding cassette subfamily C (CFTR/MRP) protein 1